MKELGMAIGTAAGSVFGSLMGNKMQEDQFGNQLTLMKKQHEYNEESANAAQKRAYEMWEDTNYAAQIEQMKKANLSPGLMYGQAGAGGGTVSGAQGQGTTQPIDKSIEMKLKGQELGLQLANLASQIKLNESQANKNNVEANKTSGVDTELVKTSIENLISQTKNEKDRNTLIWAEKRFKEAAADMQEASAKLASGQNEKIGYEINLIEKSLDKMELEMNGIDLDNELKRRVMDSKVQEAEMSVKALMNSILVGNSQIKLNNQQAEAITDKVMQDWQSVAQQWNKLQQNGQSIEIDQKRMENEAKKILNDIVISGKKLTLEQQQQLLDVVLGLGGLATRIATVKGGQ
nr:MAG TPA: hypothetical protein [Microviridae sp.]